MFTDDMKIWKRLPAADKPWTRFKTDLVLVYQDLRENIAVGQGFQANNAKIKEEFNEVIIEAKKFFVTFTAAYRGAGITLINIVNTLTTDHSATTAQLVTVLVASATLITTVTSL